MRKFIENVKLALLGVAMVGVVFGVIYGSYWLAKTGSYQFFYEDMVERTVTQMVKPEYLK